MGAPAAPAPPGAAGATVPRKKKFFARFAREKFRLASLAGCSSGHPEASGFAPRSALPETSGPGVAGRSIYTRLARFARMNNVHVTKDIVTPLRG